MLEIKEKLKNPLKKSSFDDHLSWTLLRKKISELDRSVETSHSEMQKKKKKKNTFKNCGTVWKNVARMENKANE